MTPITKSLFAFSLCAAIATAATVILVTNQLAVKIILGGTSLVSLGAGFATLKKRQVVVQPPEQKGPKSPFKTFFEERTKAFIDKVTKLLGDGPKNPKVLKLLNEMLNTQLQNAQDYFSEHDNQNEMRTHLDRLLNALYLQIESDPLTLEDKLNTFLELNRLENIPIDKFKELLSKLKKEDIDTPLFFGSSLLMTSAKRGKSGEYLSLLIKKGAQLDQIDIFGNTPLIWAIANGNNEIAKGIIENSTPHDLNIRSQGMRKNTALMLAVAKGYRSQTYSGDNLKTSNVTLVKAMLDKGVDPNIQDAKGNTALHYAAARHDKEMVELLVKVTRDVQNNEGKRAVDLLKMTYDEAYAFIGAQTNNNFLLPKAQFDENLHPLF